MPGLRRLGRPVAIALSLTAIACATSPLPVTTEDPAVVVGAAISRDDAIAIARVAAGDILPWLEPIEVSSAERSRFGDHANEFALRGSPPPGDCPVWVVTLFDEGMGQGATVLVDLADGRVLQAVSFIE